MKEGWEYKKLGEVCNIDFGTRVVKSRDAGTIYPVYGGGGATFKMDIFNREDCMVISRFGMSLQCTRFVKGKFFLNDSGLTLSIKKDCIIQSFMDWAVLSLNNTIYSLGRGAAQKNLDTKALADIIISFPNSLSEQQSIVDYLDAAFAKIDALKANAEKQLNDARALFHAELSESMMPKEGWEEKVLKDIGVLKNGMNFNKNEFGYTVHILGVGDFGNQFQINDTDYLQTISLNSNPSEDYFLKNDDIVFVRSNGNKHLVGRCVLIHVGEEPCSFSGFCIRFRKLTNEVDSCFLTHFLKTDEARKKLVGNGANISNLNQKVLNEFVVSYPSIQEQQQIVAHLDALSAKVKELEKINEQTQKECDALKQAMLREIFE